MHKAVGTRWRDAPNKLLFCALFTSDFTMTETVKLESSDKEIFEVPREVGERVKKS